MYPVATNPKMEQFKLKESFSSMIRQESSASTKVGHILLNSFTLNPYAAGG